MDGLHPYEPGIFHYSVLDLFILRLSRRVQLTIAATNKPVSSTISREMAAKNPIIDHKNGIIKTKIRILFSVQRSIPKVKIVVGQGKPKLGAAG